MYRSEDKEVLEEPETSSIAIDEKKRGKAFAPALNCPQGSASTDIWAPFCQICNLRLARLDCSVNFDVSKERHTCDTCMSMQMDFKAYIYNSHVVFICVKVH